MENIENWLTRYTDLCNWLAFMFPDFWIADQEVVVTRKGCLAWKKKKDEVTISLIFYGVKNAFWETTIAPRLSSDYPEITSFGVAGDRQVLTFKTPSNFSDLSNAKILFYNTPIGVGRLALGVRRDDPNEYPPQ